MVPTNWNATPTRNTTNPTDAEKEERRELNLPVPLSYLANLEILLPDAAFWTNAETRIASGIIVKQKSIRRTMYVPN